MARVLALMAALLHLVRGAAPRDDREEVAAAIAAATRDPGERAALVVVSWYESGFGQVGDLRFGVLACRRLACSVPEEARRAAGILRAAARACGTSRWRARLSYFNTGRVRGDRCPANRYGRRGAARVAALLGTPQRPHHRRHHGRHHHGR